ncbi:MAG: hypothetical protein J0I84_15650 [Terrimonas sp.]|nr:hypothetical protein [Terrimonas sp.]OJY92198.1 MAG: hypothetical protein BGP13_08525 [Sphingobacteriales bacterium 40-81]
MNKILYKTFDENPNESLELIKSFTNGYDFREDQYKIFRNVFDLTKLKEYWKTVFPPKEIDAEKAFWVEHRPDMKQTDLNLLRQFFYWEAKDEKSMRT